MLKKKNNQLFIFPAAVALLAFLVGIYSCSGKKTSDYSCGVPDCDITAPIDSFFNTLWPDPSEPGAVVAVMKNDTIIYCKGFGVADLATGARMTDTTLVNIASATKSFTTGALLNLAESGKVCLDSSLSCYFPELKAELFGKITLRNVLSHTSGIPDLRPRNPEEWSKYLAHHTSVFAKDDDYRLYGTDYEHFHIFENMTSLEFEPGSNYTRDEPAYTMLSLLIPRVTGVPFTKWMDDNLFRPSGMSDVFYITPGSDFPRSAHGYRPVDPKASRAGSGSKYGRWEEYDYGEAPFFISRSECGAFTTIHDFMNWKRAFYSGKIVNNDLFMEMFQPLIDTELEWKKYGLGCALTIRPGMPVREYHRNTNGGFCDVESSWPESRLHYAVFSNRSDMPLFRVLDTMDSILISNGYLK